MGNGATTQDVERTLKAIRKKVRKVTSSSDGPYKPQYAALPYRLNDKGQLEILLISSRDTGRWIVPKGWPIKKCSGPETAETEAFEEAGIKGVVDTKPIGKFDYLKTEKGRADRCCRVTVYPMRVDKDLKKWPEKDERRLRWLSPVDAAIEADDPGLATLILRLAEHLGHPPG